MRRALIVFLASTIAALLWWFVVSQIGYLPGTHWRRYITTFVIIAIIAAMIRRLLHDYRNALPSAIIAAPIVAYAVWLGFSFVTAGLWWRF